MQKNLEGISVTIGMRTVLVGACNFVFSSLQKKCDGIAMSCGWMSVEWCWTQDDLISSQISSKSEPSTARFLFAAAHSFLLLNLHSSSTFLCAQRVHGGKQKVKSQQTSSGWALLSATSTYNLACEEMERALRMLKQCHILRHVKEFWRFQEFFALRAQGDSTEDTTPSFATTHQIRPRLNSINIL